MDFNASALCPRLYRGRLLLKRLKLRPRLATVKERLADHLSMMPVLIEVDDEVIEAIVTSCRHQPRFLVNSNKWKDPLTSPYYSSLPFRCLLK